MLSRFFYWRIRITYGLTVCNEAAELDRLLAFLLEHKSRRDEIIVLQDITVADEAVTALAQATREAVGNAAKHSGATTVALYSEVTPGAVTVFVRDRGAGFDPGSVPADRRGLRDSVVGRLQRIGGTAVVHSRPGEGTEVELTLPREAS